MNYVLDISEYTCVTKSNKVLCFGTLNPNQTAAIIFFYFAIVF